MHAVKMYSFHSLSSVSLVHPHSPTGHCGPPLPCNIVKLIDVPEMDYYAKDNKGEVTVHMSRLMTKPAK